MWAAPVIDAVVVPAAALSVHNSARVQFPGSAAANNKVWPLTVTNRTVGVNITKVVVNTIANSNPISGGVTRTSGPTFTTVISPTTLATLTYTSAFANGTDSVFRATVQKGGINNMIGTTVSVYFGTNPTPLVFTITGNGYDVTL